MKKFKEFIQNFYKHIKPPYSGKDVPYIISLVVLFFVSAVVSYSSRWTNPFSRAASDTHIRFVNQQTLQPITTTTTAQVGVLLESPWPTISEADENSVVYEDMGSDMHAGEVAGVTTPTGKATGSPTPRPKASPTTSPTPTARPTATPTPSSQGTTQSIVLAEDSGFTRNLITISPVTSNPFFTTYTFSNTSLGTKTLFAKFVSSTGTTQTFNSTIELVSQTSVTPTPISNGSGPYPSAPLCPDSGNAHNNSIYHGLWDNVRRCHYDHEHGDNPFTHQVAMLFPESMDLETLLGGVEIGHTNPSGPMENTMKHGGFKWNVYAPAPQGGAPGFEDATYGVDAAAIQYHAFGNYAIEFEARVHSAAGIFRQFIPGEAPGYLYTTQYQDYGQMLFNYQGTLMPFPNAPVPSYPTGLGPYWAWSCIHCGAREDTREAILAVRGNVSTTVTSKGQFSNPQGILKMLIRARDLYQVVDMTDMTHPFTSFWLCSRDGGLTYSAIPGCRYNNSTTRVHEVRINIPQAWDNQAFDRNRAVGRITANVFTTVGGTLNPSCTTAGLPDCFPTVMVDWKPGHTGSELQVSKTTQFQPQGVPERDIYFCGGVACSEGSAGAVSSGWIGPNN